MRAAILALGITLAGWPLVGRGQVYKYVKKDGTIVYTDRLSALPKERRRHYNRLEAERARQAERVKSEVASDEAARKAAEAERSRLRAEADARNEARLRALDAEIQRLRKKNEARDRVKAQWTQRYRQTKAELQETLAAFERTQQQYQELAIKAEFALFPGQKEEKFKLLDQLKALEARVDRLNHELTVAIPEQARKAGIPPGWVRG
jgi:chromosome segregation ATPase